MWEGYHGCHGTDLSCCEVITPVSIYPSIVSVSSSLLIICCIFGLFAGSESVHSIPISAHTRTCSICTSLCDFPTMLLQFSTTYELNLRVMKRSPIFLNVKLKYVVLHTRHIHDVNSLLKTATFKTSFLSRIHRRVAAHHWYWYKWQIFFCPSLLRMRL